MSLLSAQRLSIVRGQRTLVRDLCLQIEPGTCWGLLGANGAGKTSLLLSLAGLLSAPSDALNLMGKPLARWPQMQKALHLGMLFQQPEAELPGTVMQHVLAGRFPHSSAWGWHSPDDLAAARAALAECGLAELREQEASKLSGGERQRLEIARLLAQAPKLALLDEPSNHLDPGQQIAMLDLLKSRFTAPGHALLMVLHDINLSLRYCDHLLMLLPDGHWLAGTTAELATEANLSDLYQHPMRWLGQGTEGVFLPQ